MPHPATRDGTPSTSPAPDTLDLPLYRATFGESVKRFFKKYGTFDGRASRSEYWWIMLLNIMVSLACMALMAAGGADLFAPDGAEFPDIAAPWLLLLLTYYLVTIIPNWALGMRRFHDAGFSGGLYFLYMLPYVGWPIVLVLALMPPDPAGARYDRDSAWPTNNPAPYSRDTSTS